ncbi:MAG: hypothetical protein HYY50_02425 [Candidatus Kerfeldbacteria bacterium]|nr:hypothetical protein [Candidatus Kerfeldbacteria bacterium]
MAHLHLPSRRVVRAIKILIVLAPVVLLAWLVNQRFVLTPTVTFSYRPGTKPGAVQPETGKIIRSYRSAWRVDDDVVKVKVRIPRVVESVRFKATLLNRNQPVIRLVAAGLPEFGDQVRLIRHRTLDELDWPRLQNDHLNLWQRPSRLVTQPAVGPDGLATTTSFEQPVRQYAGLDEFFSNLPPVESFATVDLDPLLFVSVANYQPSAQPTTIAHAFRGKHTLYVYAADEDIRLSFEKIDLNRDRQPDPLTVTVRKLSLNPMETTLLFRAVVPDDGSQLDQNLHGPPQPVDVMVPNVVAGLYRIDVGTSEDVIFRNLVSYQRYLAFQDAIFLADGPTYTGSAPPFRPLQIRTHSPRVSFRTKHDEGRQRIYSGQQTVFLDQAGSQVQLNSLPSGATIDLEKGDVLIAGQGFITIAPAVLPSQPPRGPISVGSKSLESIDYLVGRYKPQSTFGRVVIDESYRLSRLLLTTNDLHFQLEFPGLRDKRRVVEPRRVSAQLVRGSFPWGKIVRRIEGLLP